MPFKSVKQRKYLFSQKPEVAKEFESKTKKGVSLPEKVKKKKKRTVRKKRATKKKR